MINRDYSVTIRTLGTAEDKYQRTLDSIATQSIQPKEVIIVLANGYECPKEQLGYERFVFVDKGMVNQRVACFPQILWLLYLLLWKSVKRILFLRW